MFWTILALAIGIPAIVLLFLFFRQDDLIYHPRPYASWEPDPGSGIVTLEYTAPDGLQTAYYLSPQDAASNVPADLWLLFGGNASLALDWLDFVLAARDSASGFLFIDYPGYGRCEGKPTPDGILLNTEGALATLGKRLGVEFPVGGSGGAEGYGRRGAAGAGLPGGGTAAPRLHVLGHSLGSAAALQCAARRPVDRVILLSPFTSMSAMAELVVGRWLSGLLRHRFDNVARLQELRARRPQPRVFIFHGSDDTVVPVRMGRTLAASAPEMVTYVEVPAVGHNDLLAVSGAGVGAAMFR